MKYKVIRNANFGKFINRVWAERRLNCTIATFEDYDDAESFARIKNDHARGFTSHVFKVLPIHENEKIEVEV